MVIYFPPFEPWLNAIGARKIYIYMSLNHYISVGVTKVLQMRVKILKSKNKKGVRFVLIPIIDASDGINFGIDFGSVIYHNSVTKNIRIVIRFSQL